MLTSRQTASTLRSTRLKESLGEGGIVGRMRPFIDSRAWVSSPTAQAHWFGVASEESSGSI